MIIPTIGAHDLLAQCRAGIPPGVQVVIADEQQPFAENCNLGAEYSSGELLVFLNDDTLPQPGWVDALTDPFADERIGITGARLTYPDGRIQHAGIHFVREYGVLTAYNTLQDLPSRYVEAVTGACLAIRRELFEDLGGFDTGYRNGYEDVDLCLRARAEGWRVWYCADADVIHYESASGAARWSHVRENVQRLQEKWPVGNHFGI